MPVAADTIAPSTVAVGLTVGAVVIGAILWTPLSLIPLSLENSRMNRRIVDAERPHPDEVRNSRVIAAQFVPMSVVTLMAGALAGIGASMFVDNGRLRWPSSQAPLALIVSAIALTELIGIVLVAYLTRPTWAWIEDSSVFRSYLRQVKARGWAGERELAQLRKRQSTWAGTTNVRPLRSPRDLRELGLELPAAYKEWASPDGCDHAEFGAELQADVSRKQIERWIMRRRLWRLGIPPLVTALAIAGEARGLMVVAGLPFSLSLVLTVPVAFCCGIVLYWLAFRVGRLDLVMTNRYLALERAQLRDCDQLMAQIDELHTREQANASPASADSSADWLTLRIGRWEICRHHNGTQATRRSP
jgi:hypothetical protein